MLAGDEEITVAELMIDPRARHYWDGRRILGRHFARAAGFGTGAVAWDVFLVYGPDAAWGDPPIATGAPVVARGAELRAALAPYLS